MELKKTTKRSVSDAAAKPQAKKFKPSAKPGDKPFKGKPAKPGDKKFGNKKFIGKKGGKPAPPPVLEKTNWNELKQKKKDLKVQRRKNKSKELYDIDVKAKKIYEELKMKKNTKANKEKLCHELHDLMKNADYSKLTQSPDRARIIQTLLKKAPQSIRTEIGEKLIPFITEVALSKYGKFCVERLMKFCGKDIREKAVNGMFKNIVKLTSHNFSSPLIDSIFLNHATPDQKNFMKQEFYAELYKNDKSRAVKTLKDTWAGSDMMKNGILNSTKMNLLKIASKNLVDNSLIHSVLLEFIEEAGETDRNEIITSFIPHLAAIASTKAGSRSAALCYLYSVAKERRAMLKAIKEHVTKLCTHEHGHLLILEILNSTDDTQNIKKTIFAQIVSDIETIASNEYGKRVILFVVSPTKEFFHPRVLQELDEDLKLGTQKKDVDIRRKELFEGVAKELCDSIKANPSFWLKGGHIARVTLAFLQGIGATTIDPKEAFDALCSVICDVEWKVPEVETTVSDQPEPEVKDTGKIKKKKKNPIEVVVEHKDPVLVSGIEHSGLHIAIKKICKLAGFSKSFAEHLTEDIIDNWVKINRACFVLVEVLENADEETKAELKKTLAQHKAVIQKQSFSGAKVLLKILQ